MIRDDCTGCAGCAALEAEAGTLAPMYAKKVLIRGWAGKLSDAERLYLRHHPPEWYRQALTRTPPSAAPLGQNVVNSMGTTVPMPLGA